MAVAVAGDLPYGAFITRISASNTEGIANNSVESLGVDFDYIAPTE